MGAGNRPVIRFSLHVLQRMFERGITQSDVQAALSAGRIVEDYPDDYPIPSRLWLGYSDNRPLHVVYADTPTGERVIITAYEPDPAKWSSDFTQRTQS